MKASSLVEFNRKLMTASKLIVAKDVSPALRATKRMIKSKRERVTMKRKGSSAVEATSLGLNTKSGLRPILRYKTSLIYYRGQLPG